MATGQIRTILVPTDFSEGAATAFEWARTLALAFRAEIVLLHVIDLSYVWTPISGLGAIPTPISTELVQRVTADVKRALDTMTTGAPEVTRRLLRKGHPREVILEVAHEVGADVIVMGTHGRRGFSHLFIGSVAEHVVRQAPVPVWTVCATVKRSEEPAGAIQG
jgi:universal stress protein A